MATVNNIYVTAGEPIMRYLRIPKHGITGWRLDPDDRDRKIIFELTPTDDTFMYERDVVEVYTDKELKFFKQANKYLFQQGFLTEYIGEPEPIDTSNMLTDAQVLEIASERSVKRIEAKLKELTSLVSVQRIYDTATEIGRPSKTLEIMKARLDELKQ